MNYWLEQGCTEHQIRHWWPSNNVKRDEHTGNIIRTNRRGGTLTVATRGRKGSKEPSLRIGRNVEKRSVDANILQTAGRIARWGALRGSPTLSGPRGSGPAGRAMVAGWAQPATSQKHI
eukprot:2952045-Pyramimonas_sp.AAC.1